MPRDIPVGNGSLLINFDSRYRLRDLYWPHVGQENHTAGHPCRLGVWIDGQFSWVDGKAWSRTLAYEPDTLSTQVTLYNPALNLRLICQDVVDFEENLYVRRITAMNMAEEERELRLFFTHDFHISGHELGDAAYYEPERRAVFHYKGKRWFMMNVGQATIAEWEIGIDQWTVDIKEAPVEKCPWRDAKDGQLSGHAAAQGSVDSAIALHLTVPGRDEATGWYWIAVGENFRQVTRLDRAVRRKGPEHFRERTCNDWRLWVAKENRSREFERHMDELPHDVRNLYRRSLLILRTQIDDDGAIVAASDSDITHNHRDTYAYMWPRDGALVAAALIDAGYPEIARRFFDFCHRVITDEGYLLHKYNPDGSLASSWHAWYYEGEKPLPVQEDETGLVLWALWRHFQHFRDIEFVKAHYRGLIVRAANWMSAYRDRETGLPLPSWGPWEERRGVFA